MKLNRLLIVCILTLVSQSTFSQNDLKNVKELLEGNWKGDKRITTFSFESDTSGFWEVENTISTAPLFVIYVEKNIFYVGSIDLLGSGNPYPFEIVTLNKKELVLKDIDKGDLLKYKRK